MVLITKSMYNNDFYSEFVFGNEVGNGWSLWGKHFESGSVPVIDKASF